MIYELTLYNKDGSPVKHPFYTVRKDQAYSEAMFGVCIVHPHAEIKEDNHKIADVDYCHGRVCVTETER